MLITIDWAHMDTYTEALSCLAPAALILRVSSEHALLPGLLPSTPYRRDF